jgi:hypothetical protein
MGCFLFRIMFAVILWYALKLFNSINPSQDTWENPYSCLGELKQFDLVWHVAILIYYKQVESVSTATLSALERVG